MLRVVVENEKLIKIALTRRMLVSFGAYSTDIYFLVTGVPHLDPQVLLQLDTVLPMAPIVHFVNPVLLRSRHISLGHLDVAHFGGAGSGVYAHQVTDLKVVLESHPLDISCTTLVIHIGKCRLGNYQHHYLSSIIFLFSTSKIEGVGLHQFVDGVLKFSR